MNYTEALEYIHSICWTFTKPGLERISALCEKLGNPQDELKFIHVAGTNGKGSVCAMLDSILRAAGYRLWLLSNAQEMFTAYELNHLGLTDIFDAIYISSRFGYRKPDVRFFRALLEEHQLDPKKCLMIGNDRDTDIAGAKAQGMATFYMHTNITPPGQAPADPARHPSCYRGPDYEYEGADWFELVRLVEKAAGL